MFALFYAWALRLPGEHFSHHRVPNLNWLLCYIPLCKMLSTQHQAGQAAAIRFLLMTKTLGR
jgi:hypothetical protein